MKFNPKVLLCFHLILITVFACQKEEFVDVTNKAALDKVVDAEFRRLQMPGLACMAVKDDSIVYLSFKGYANREEKIAFSNQTRMLIASTSKTITLTAIMQLYEKGLINLDADINSYLPFSVRNPQYPDTPITVRMLLNHTSSISDGGYMSSLYYLFGYVDYPESLMDFEQSYLTTSGASYTKKNYSKNKPGDVYSYSNVGAALIACLVEQLTDTSFNDYCKSNIFIPLGMDKTTWFFSETPENEIAIPYADNNITNPTKPFYTYPTYPDGHLITTIEDLSKFLRAYMMNGAYNNYQLLQPQTIDTILQKHSSASGIGHGLIFYTQEIGNFEVWGHNGGDPGVSTEMFFDREKRIGYIMFNNRTEAYSAALSNALLLHANQY